MDPLLGLKENVIIGKLIPVGTGMRQYRDVQLSNEKEVEEIIDEVIEEVIEEGISEAEVSVEE